MFQLDVFIASMAVDGFGLAYVALATSLSSETRRRLTMSSETITSRPVTPQISAEIDGIELGRSLGNHQLDNVRRSLLRHRVLLFRNQQLDAESHKAFGQHFW
jgi:alpha-ketoglutarate-dependent taurine dioxygenase